MSQCHTTPEQRGPDKTSNLGITLHIIWLIYKYRNQKKNRWLNCVQTDINTFKIKNWKRGQKTVLTGRSSLRRHRSAFGCNATSGGGGGGGRRTRTRLQKRYLN